MLDDLTELRTFRAIVARGSLSNAANELGVGLAVVSKRLASLEQRVGLRLLNRTTRRLSPTDEGLALLPHIDRMLEELALAEARLASGKEAPQGLLRVSAPVSCGRFHVAPVAGELVALYPKLNIDLRFADRLIDLVEERIDIAVRIGQPRDSSATFHKLVDSHRILVASPAYLDRHGTPCRPADLGRHICPRYDEGSEPWRLIGPGGEDAVISTDHRLRANSGDAVQDWAVAGLGIILKSEIDVAADVASGRLRRVLPEWQSAPAPVYALTQPGRHLTAKTKIFIEALRTRLRRIIGHGGQSHGNNL